MKVEQIMTKKVHCCQPTDSLEYTAQIMWDKDCGCLPVCTSNESKNIVGMITDRDITMCALFQAKPLSNLNVSQAMSRKVHFCYPSDSFSHVEKLMRENKIRRLPVVNKQNSVIGIISLADLAQEAKRESLTDIKEINDKEVNHTFVAICTPNIKRCTPHVF